MKANSIYLRSKRISFELLSPFDKLVNIFMIKHPPSIQHLFITSTNVNTNKSLIKYQRASTLAWLCSYMIVNYSFLYTINSPILFKTKLIDLIGSLLFIKRLIIWKRFFVRIPIYLELFLIIFFDYTLLAIYSWLQKIS